MFLALSACLLPLAAQASCHSAEAAIRARIQAHGVHAFSLQDVPADQVSKVLKAGGKVVGHCRNHTRKIIYRRGHADQPAAAASRD
jgi:Protein of unknown function (DUF1161).